MQLEEQWLSIPSHPRWQVSNLGRVKGPRGKVLKLQKNKQGYMFFKAYIDSQEQFILVHRAVCEAFHGLSPFPGARALHGDDNKENNAATNLEWGTQLKNIRQSLQSQGLITSFEGRNIT